ncbi:hypothetical protein N474_14970 [Pseudoalteromonas luteoviolacea CPMOR-2]|uniref:Uncharacterized protein n=1 Tax=Pseudoalteromonas luteoviolacea DSM 6061 TaxID=1365250 RepID=A0A166X6W1_9GAMM|nr:hypothetical protein N475_13360 [Pseudoalteromonas luteoviolacea DSM 6061]KZN55285.1 hypothetical protein N474_14970 [Pseudoalteromonas luteoviolacea CPMOR-2]
MRHRAPFGSIGYISLVADNLILKIDLGIVCTSWFTTPIGANATNYLPVPTVKKIFAMLLVIMAINMIFN